MKRKRQTLTYEHQRLFLAREEASVTESLPRGCGVRRVLPSIHVESLVTLCDDIRGQVTSAAPWGEGMDDKRRRCYGFIDQYSKWNVPQWCGW
jgi:hypothetical protein